MRVAVTGTETEPETQTAAAPPANGGGKSIGGGTGEPGGPNDQPAPVPESSSPQKHNNCVFVVSNDERDIEVLRQGLEEIHSEPDDIVQVKAPDKLLDTIDRVIKARGKINRAGIVNLGEEGGLFEIIKQVPSIIHNHIGSIKQIFLGAKDELEESLFLHHQLLKPIFHHQPHTMDARKDYARLGLGATKRVFNRFINAIQGKLPWGNKDWGTITHSPNPVSDVSYEFTDAFTTLFRHDARKPYHEQKRLHRNIYNLKNPDFRYTIFNPTEDTSTESFKPFRNFVLQPKHWRDCEEKAT